MRKAASKFPFGLVLIPLGITLVVGILVWANYTHLSELASDGEFLVYWTGTRALIMDGDSPYLTEYHIPEPATFAFFQRSARETTFLAPLYLIFPVAPFAMFTDFALAQSLWMALLQLSLLALLILSFRLLGSLPRSWMLPFYTLFALLWVPGISVILGGSFVALIILFLVLALLAYQQDRYEFAGIFLALTTIRFDIVFLVLPLIVIWLVSRRRWKVIIWMVGSILFLTGLGMLLIPNWPLQLIWELRRVSPFDLFGVVRSIFLTWWPGVGYQVTAWFLLICLALLGFEFWAVWKKDIRHLVWTLSFTLTLSVWLGYSTNIDAIFILLLPMLLIFTGLENRWKGKGNLLVLLLMLVAGGGLWFDVLNPTSAQGQYNPAAFFFLPLLVLIGLYWLRWWMTRPAHLYLEE